MYTVSKKEWFLSLMAGDRTRRKNRDVFRDDNRRRIQNPVKHLRWSFLQNNRLYLTVYYFCKTLHIFVSQGICLDKTKQNLGVRSNRPEVLCRKGVLRKFAKFTGNHLCQRIFSNKFAALRPATLLKKRLCHRCFPVNFSNFLRTPILTGHLWWLLL